MKYVFMSFKPLYAHEIVNGVKDCEVRTYLGSVEPGDIIIIYSSSPEKSVIGEFKVKWRLIDLPKTIVSYLNSVCKKFNELNWAFFRERYLRSKRKLMLIKIGDAVKYPRAVTLAEIRRYVPHFRPPVSYVRVTEELVTIIKMLISRRG